MKYLKSAMPHIVAVFIFFVLASTYFAPHYKGYDISYGVDVQTSIGATKEINDFRKLENKDPLWTNAMFGGMPTYQVSMQNTSNILPHIESFLFVKFLGYSIGYLLIAMISFYIMLLCFGVSPWLSIIGAIAFGFSSINILYLGNGHVTKIHAIALLPGIVGSLYYAYRKNMFNGALLLSIFVCLHLSANHLQQTYYFLFLALAFILVEFYRSFKEKLLVSFFKVSLVLAIATTIGVLPTVSNLIVTNEYSKFSTRSKSELTISKSAGTDNSQNTGLERDYIKQYSLGYGEIWSVAVPDQISP
jgi:hypothetical protein